LFLDMYAVRNELGVGDIACTGSGDSEVVGKTCEELVVCGVCLSNEITVSNICSDNIDKSVVSNCILLGE
jgi:hypothetical protein